MSKKVALISGITGQDYSETFFFIQHRTYRTSVSGRMGAGYEAEPTGEPALGGYDGQQLTDTHHTVCTT